MWSKGAKSSSFLRRDDSPVHQFVHVQLLLGLCPKGRLELTTRIIDPRLLCLWHSNMKCFLVSIVYRLLHVSSPVLAPFITSRSPRL
jgi:hypothetical protein